MKKQMIRGIMIITVLMVYAMALTTEVNAQAVIDNTTVTTNAVYYVGDSTAANSLVITNNGQLFVTDSDVNDFSSIIGNTIDSSNNTALVTESGSLWTNQNSLVVGNSGVANTLTISNGARVENSVGYVGFLDSSSNNVVTVTGAGSLWSNRNDLFVGFRGAANTLTISNGARVENFAGAIGVVSSSSNNVVTVTGAGSLWTNRSDLRLGDTGAGNALTISNGASVFNALGRIGDQASSSNNVVLVTGANSMWSNRNDLFLGLSGAANTLTISNGARVVNNIGYVGFFASSSNNVVLVTGANSLWSNRSSLFVGRNGAGNTLTISNGASVIAASLIVGANASSINNVMNLSGAASQLVVTNAAGTSTSDIRRGTFTQNGGTLRTDNLLATNAAGLYTVNGGTAIVQNASISNGQNFVIGGTDGTGGGAVYIAHTGVHSLQNSLFVGSNTAANTLTISNGASVLNDTGTIGNQASSSNNVVTVTGASSLWSNRNDLSVGNLGASNTLTISNGASVVNDFGRIGFRLSSSNNVATVTGANSIWSNQSDLFVGNEGAGNALTISNGASVFSDDGAIGDLSSSNVVLVTGANSIWSNLGSLYVGFAGASNTLTIRNGGRVENSVAIIGSDFRSSNNVVLVTGANSIWSNRSDLFVGDGGAGNALTISNEASVVNDNATIGDSSSNNVVVVTGANSLWSNLGSLYVGDGGAGNALTISNEASVVNDNATIGFTTSALNNVVVVTGANSLWSNRSNLYVGDRGAGNALTITNGGSVENNIGSIGQNASSSNNVVTVTGANSMWSNRDDLYVGNFGAANTLTISNGASVENDFGYIGGNVSSSNNVVLLTGANSLWSNRSGLYVGYVGEGNTLTISNGARVENNFGSIGFTTSSSNNVVLVTGANSMWSNRNDLYVGNEGAGNALTISNGGSVENNSGLIGFTTHSSNNAVTVTGANSLWSNRSDLRVGDGGAGNALTISNGASVMAASLIVGVNASSIDNVINLSGAASQMVVTNAAGTSTSDIRNGTFTQNGGTFRTDNLLLADTAGLYSFNGGTAIVGVANINNGQTFQVGNGTSAAYFHQTIGSATNTFANGLTINTNGVFSFAGAVTDQITLNGGTLKGQGTYVGNLTVGGGSILAPGNSPGTLTNFGNGNWTNNGIYQFEVNSFSGTQGADPGWDFYRVVGSLDITADSLNPFLIDITSLTLSNTPGSAFAFNDTANYSFTLVETTLGVSGFSANKFNLSTVNFQNPFTGSWTISQSGNNLLLNYTAVPEPSTYALLVLGAICAGISARRRSGGRKQTADCAD